MKKYLIIGGIIIGVVALGFFIPPPDGFFGASTPDSLKDVDFNKINTRDLLDLLEEYSDLEYLIDMQNASGIAHKDITDPDVKDLKDSVIFLRKEVEKRLKPSDIALLDEVLLYSKQIAHKSAQGALGIPDINKTKTEIQQIKSNFNTTRINLESIIK